MWFEKFASSCNPSVYYNWSERPKNIALHEHRISDVQGGQDNHFSSGIIETIMSWASSGKMVLLIRCPDQEPCVVSHLEQYIEQTKNLWKN